MGAWVQLGLWFTGQAKLHTVNQNVHIALYVQYIGVKQTFSFSDFRRNHFRENLFAKLYENYENCRKVSVKKRQKLSATCVK